MKPTNALSINKKETFTKNVVTDFILFYRLAVRISGLDMFNLNLCFDFKFDPIFATDRTASNNNTNFKSGHVIKNVKKT